MAKKIFYVTRTEDEDTATAGEATLHRADEPQLLKIVSIDENNNPDPAEPVENNIYATEEEGQEVLLTSTEVAEGNMNPVTSDAVNTSLDALKEEMQAYIRDQDDLDTTYESFSNSSSAFPLTFPYDGFLYFTATGATTSSRFLGTYTLNGHSFNYYGLDSDGVRPWGNLSVIPFRKGDTFSASGDCRYTTCRYYKKRDYSTR